MPDQPSGEDLIKAKIVETVTSGTSSTSVDGVSVQKILPSEQIKALQELQKQSVTPIPMFMTNIFEYDLHVRYCLLNGKFF